MMFQTQIRIVRLSKDRNSVKAQCGEIKWISYEGELAVSHCIYLRNIHAKFEKKVTERK